MRRLVVGLAIISVAALALSWAQADDQEIAKEITERLKHEQTVGALHDFDINLKVADGNVVLKGRVVSPEQQKVALDTARAAKGVKKVFSELAVGQGLAKPSPAEPTTAATEAKDASASDADIGAAISAELTRLKEAGSLKGFGISISVNQGVVLLRGRVSNSEQMRMAIAVAQKSPGVRQVTNRVIVVSTTCPEAKPTETKDQTAAASPNGTVSDDDIAQQIAAGVKAEKSAGRLKGFDIDLSVQDGVVVYAGQVSTSEQIEVAVALARKTAGVRDVINKLVVASAPAQAGTPEPVSDPATAAAAAAAVAVAAPAVAPAASEPPRDADIARQLVAQLKERQAAGDLKGFDVDLEVKKGVVHYRGRVATEEQLQLVLGAARNIAGVQDVVHQLTVSGAQAASPQAAPQTAPAEALASAPSSPASRADQAPAAETGTDAAPTPTPADGPMPAPSPYQTASLPIPADAGDLTESTVRPIGYEATRPGAPNGDHLSSDQRIGQELTARLEAAKRSGNLRGFGISLQVDHGDVWLQGRVSSADQREFATSLARSVAGVRSVNNELTLPPGSTGLRSLGTPATMGSVVRKYPSEEIAQRLAERLRAEEQRGKLRGSRLDAQVVGGQVVLQGRAADADQRELAVEIARRVPGVEKVIDSLTIGPSGAGDPNVALVAGSQGIMPGAYGPMAVNPAPRPLGALQTAAYVGAGVLAAPLVAVGQMTEGGPMPAQLPGPGYAQVPARYDHPNLPGYAWPSYAASPNYAAVTYPKQYSPTAWPYIGPFYPYPQVPLGWRKVTLKWDDGWWQLNFKSK